MTRIQNDNKREEILKAAEKEFVLHGYDGARIVAIAKRACVGHPLLHYHLKTKKELFKFVVFRKIDLLRQSVMMSWDESGKNFLEKLSATIGKHFDFVRGNADYLRFQIREMEYYPEIFTDIQESFHSHCRPHCPKMGSARPRGKLLRKTQNGKHPPHPQPNNPQP